MMYQRIIVPLDGSRYAESALPFACALACRTDPYTAQPLSIRLVEVVAPKEDTTWSLDDAEGAMSIAEDYLATVRATLLAYMAESGCAAGNITTEVVYDAKDRAIAGIIRQMGADLIVMATHGRRGIARLVLSSFATHLLRHAGIPVLMIRPDEAESARGLDEKLRTNMFLGPDIGPVLATLDGTAEAEAVLDVAQSCAATLHTPLALVRVVVPPDPLSVSGKIAVKADYDVYKEIQEDCRDAEAYIAAVEMRMRETGQDCTSVVRVGDPVRMIVEESRVRHAAVLAMATHARHRVGRFLLGSVADAVLTESHLPILLIQTPNPPETPHP